MNENQRQIETLIREWAAAVHAGDIDTVLTYHSGDIVMFDVPPPEAGIRGIDAYRDAWPGFFEWQAAGGTFDVLELDVTAGDDVAYAWVLLRCGVAGEAETKPDKRLRLTLGLRKDDGRWTVSHEHHSFTSASYQD